MQHTIEYGKLNTGSLFRILPEPISQGKLAPPKWVNTEGVFLKIGNSHAVRVEAGQPDKTIIPALHAKCVPVGGGFNPFTIPEYHISNRRMANGA